VAANEPKKNLTIAIALVKEKIERSLQVLDWLAQRNDIEREVQVKKSDKTILTGMQTYHNYIRPYEALEGTTPAEALTVSSCLWRRPPTADYCSRLISWILPYDFRLNRVHLLTT